MVEKMSFSPISLDPCDMIPQRFLPAHPKVNGVRNETLTHNLMCVCVHTCVHVHISTLQLKARIIIK